jgi:hypothetical protein
VTVEEAPGDRIVVTLSRAEWEALSRAHESDRYWAVLGWMRKAGMAFCCDHPTHTMRDGQAECDRCHAVVVLSEPAGIWWRA